MSIESALLLSTCGAESASSSLYLRSQGSASPAERALSASAGPSMSVRMLHSLSYGLPMCSLICFS